MKNFLKSEVIERGRELRLSFPSVCLPFNLTIFQMSVLASFHVHGMSLQLFGFLEGVAIVLSKFEESSGSSGIGFRMCMLGENPSETKELCCTGEIKKLGIGRLGGFQLSGRRNQETVEAFGHGTLRFEGGEGIGRTTRKVGGYFVVKNLFNICNVRVFCRYWLYRVIGATWELIR